MGNKVSIVGEEAEVKRFNMYPPNDVREWSLHFKSKYMDGHISKIEMEKMFLLFFLPYCNAKKGYGPKVTEDKSENKNKINVSFRACVSRFIEQLYNTIDIRGNNKVCFDDILVAFSTLNKGSKIEKLKWIFRFYDADKDGKISKDEFTKAYMNIYVMGGREYDKNKIDEFVGGMFEDKVEITFNDLEELSEKNKKNFVKIASFTAY